MTPLEHAAAYGTLANGGIYIEPKLYTKVIGMNNELVLENVSSVKEVVRETTAYLVTDMLKDVINGSEATGGSARIPNMTVAGKTGTSNDSKDRWFAGYTPYYVASTWVGYDEQKTVNMSGNPAAKIWKADMEIIHKDLPNKDFKKPSGIVTLEVCADSGMLVTDACRNDRRGDRTKTEIFAKENLPTKECTMHKYVEVCPDTFKFANPTCKTETNLINLVFIDRGYEEEPSKLPKDYEYEAPTSFCTYHFCEVDENGYFIEPEDNNRYEYDDEIIWGSDYEEEEDVSRPFWWD